MDSSLTPADPVQFVHVRWRRRRPARPAEKARPAVILAAAAVATAAPWLAGGQVLWGQAVVLAGIALLLAVWAPQVAPHRWAGWALLGVLALCGAQFLPAGWAGGAAWRAGLEERLALGLGPTVSPQPWVSLDRTLVLLAGLAWWWWCATALPGRAAREETAKAAVLGLTALALLALGTMAGWMPRLRWWTAELVPLGPFPNKNQMADLMATWAIVAAGCAVAGWQRRRWTALFWLGALLVLGWTTFESLSRGGTLILLAGLAVFALREGLATRELRPVAIGAAVTLCGLSLFLAFGGETLQRSVKLIQAMRESTGGDFRTLIYRDALSLIHQAPWGGLGLGNFEPVFALHREISRAPMRVIHPESDWLWLVAELGWLAPVLALLLVVPGLRNPFRSDPQERSPILDAAAIAGVAFLVHGLVDVSAHRLGSALPGLLLLGLGVRHRAAGAPRRGWPWFFRALAVAVLLVGVSWLPMMPRGLAWGRSPVVQAKQEAISANAAGRFAEAERASQAALRLAPLDWELYFLRAVAEVYQNRLDEAQADFRRARQLESSNANGPLEEGRLWAFYSYDRCAEAWGAALERGSLEGSLAIFRRIVGVGSGYADLWPTLRVLAGADWDRRLVYLEALPAADFAGEFAALLEDDPTLARPSDESLLALLTLCERRGDPASLARLLQENERAHTLAWRTLARLEAAAGHYEEAVSLGLANLTMPLPALTPLPLETAQLEFARHPQSLVAGYHQFRAQRAAGQSAAALQTLAELRALPGCPPYIPYLLGQLRAEQQAWPQAWEDLAPLLE